MSAPFDNDNQPRRFDHTDVILIFIAVLIGGSAALIGWAFRL